MEHLAAQPRIAAALVGVGAHQLVFIRGEWNKVSHMVFAGHVMALFAGIVTAAFRSYPILEVFRLAGCYLAGLYTSMLVYRQFFHRLRHFPGPVLAGLSKLWFVKRSLQTLHMFKITQELHQQYGDYVRVGPTELSIADPDAVEAIYGTKTTCTKGNYYDLFEPLISVQSTRDKEEHHRRRKIWDQGFSIKALARYEGRIHTAIADLLEVIDRDHDKPINITDWFSYFTFDIVEDLGFNMKTGMIKKGGEAYIFQTIRSFTMGLALAYHIPWISAILRRVPIITKDLMDFENWTYERIQYRKKNEPDEPDFFGNILKAFEAKGSTKEVDRLHLIGDAQLTIAAGSDTVAQPMIWLFYELAHRPDLVQQLRKELKGVELAPEKLQHVEFLDALINEALRLHPAIISGTQRMTPPQGLNIGDHFVPGNVNVMVPTYTVCRDERCFVQPNEYIPERWTTRPELIKNKSVFIPFNIGQYQCVGKRLAMMELRQATAEILTRYDVAHVPDLDPEAFHNTKADVFVLACGPLPMKFTPLE